MKKIIVMISAICILSLPIFAQEYQTPDFQTIKTDKGMMVINYNPIQAFSFLVAGKNSQGNQNPDGGIQVATDEGGLIIYFVKTSDFLEAKEKYSVSEILAIHRDGDIANEEKTFQKELHLDSVGSGTLKVFDMRKGLDEKVGLETISWGYKIPIDENSNRVFYQTVVLGDLLMMVRAVFDSSVKEVVVRNYFTQTLESITLLPSQQPKIIPKKKTTKRKSKKY